MGRGITSLLIVRSGRINHCYYLFFFNFSVTENLHSEWEIVKFTVCKKQKQLIFLDYVHGKMNLGGFTLP